MIRYDTCTRMIENAKVMRTSGRKCGENLSSIRVENGSLFLSHQTFHV